MRYKTLFRILCKILGIFFIVSGGGGLLEGTVSLTWDWWSFRGPMAPIGLLPWTPWQSISFLVGPLFQLAAGLYLFFYGQRLADLAIPGNRPYCPECGYDLSGNASDACPECGTHHQPGRPE